jgi:putative phosphoesterase
MKIGLISDIHSHLAPLQKALALLDQHGVDQIVCAGDLIGEGYEGDAVVKLLREREILCVQGNHDEEAFMDQAWMRKQPTSDTPNRLLLESWTTAHVSSLPLTRTFEWEGFKVCLAHGTPMSNTDYLFPYPSRPVPPDFPRTSIFTYLKIQMAEETSVDVYILGHTHVPMLTILNGTWFVNPGSVSRNRTDDGRTCAILTLPDRQLEVFNIETEQPVEFEWGSWETM